MNNQPHISIELTSKAVRIVAGHCINNKIFVLDAIEEKCDGLQDGLIVDAQLVVNSIINVVNRLQDNLSIKVKEVTLLLPPFNIACMPDSQSFVTASSDGIIENNDIRNIITMMKKKALGDSDLRIVDAVPLAYIINGNERYAKAPLGKRSESITIHAFLYAISDKVIQQFTKAITNAGLIVKYQAVSPYAASLYLSTIDNVPTNYIMIDVGYQITTVSYISEQNCIRSSKIINFGGHNITKNIADKLNISYQEAEELKVKYGIDKDPIIPIRIKNDITFDSLSNAITSSFDEYFELINKIVKGFNISSEQRIQIVLIGDGAKIHNFDKLLSEEINLDVVEFTSNTLGARNKSFVSVLGGIKYAEIQPTVDQEEQVISSITRVGLNIKKKKDDLDDEL